MKISPFYTAVVGSLVLAGCANNSVQTNPATNYCIQHDGQLEKNTENGATYCVLPGNHSVEQWKYYRNGMPNEND